jgi:hypothetical protein
MNDLYMIFFMIIYISVLFIKDLYNWIATCFFSHGAPVVNQTTAVIQVYCNNPHFQFKKIQVVSRAHK